MELVRCIIENKVNYCMNLLQLTSPITAETINLTQSTGVKPGICFSGYLTKIFRHSFQNDVGAIKKHLDQNSSSSSRA